MFVNILSKHGIMDLSKLEKKYIRCSEIEIKTTTDADIIHQPRPESSHPRMRREDQAKLFAPFAALSGHDQAVHDREKVLGQYFTAADTFERLDPYERLLYLKGQVIPMDDLADLRREAPHELQ